MRDSTHRSTTNHSQCLSEEQLSDFLSEQLPEQLDGELKAHIGECAECQAKLESLAAEPAMWDELNAHSLQTESASPDSANANWNHLLRQLVPSEDPRYCGRLAGYEICGLIGSGATGIVVKAFEPRLNRYVAIKVLQPTLASHGPARRRFERESRAIAAVAHEHVVPIHAVDEFQGLPFIVMQYIPGLSLLQRIEKSGSLNTCEVTRIGFQIASALAAAHSQGIIHRDVKPANIIMEDTVDRAMVTDFGLASVSDEATMTRTGTISGTPQYMSPEQARGESLDPRMDLFSLGSLMYAACTARAPFRAETVFGIIHRVCHTDARPIREINPDIAPWLVHFIDKLMSKQAEHRFDSAAEVASLLENELAHLQNPTSSPEPERLWYTQTQLTAPTTPEGPVAIDAPVTSQQVARSKSKTGMFVGIAAAIILPILGAVTLPTLDRQLKLGLLSSTTPEDEQSAEGDRSGDAGPSPSENLSQSDADQPASQTTDSNPDAQNSSDATATTTRERLINSFAALTPGEEPLVEWERADSPGLSVVSTFTQRTDQSFQFSTEQPLVLRIDRGDVEIRQTELDYVSLVILKSIKASNQEEAEKIASYHQVDVGQEPGLVSMRLDQAFVERGGDDKLERLIVGLAVPVGINIEVTSESGDILTETLSGDLSASTKMGDIRCGAIDGDLWARTQGGEIIAIDGCTGGVDLMASHGNVCVAGIEGDARVRCTDGNIYGGSNSGTLSAHATGGEIRLAAIDCRTSAHIEDGSIVVRLQDQPKADCKLTAAAGNISVRVPDSANARFQTSRQAAGNLQWETQVIEEGDAGREVLVSSLNAGGNLIELTSSTGDVRVDTVPARPESPDFRLAGNAYFSLGGSGSHSERQIASAAALAKTSGSPRAGAMVPIAIEGGHNIDGYTLYLPVSYDQSQSDYPVILYMQGGYGVGGPITRINDWGLPRLLRDENSLDSERNRLLLDSFIVVSPHISGGSYDDHPDVLEKILNDVSANYRVDERRFYATGLSRGAHASWNLVDKIPNTFAAVVPVAGRPTIDDFNRFPTTAPWVSHNRRDPTISFAQALDGTREIERATGERFTTFDIPVPTTEQVEGVKYVFTHPDIDRHDAWTDLYCSEVFYQWLLMQSLESSETTAAETAGAE